MRLLADTHVALWSVTEDQRLSNHARELIADPGNRIFVSVATLWEIAIKHALWRRGRADMEISAPAAQGYFEAAGFQILDIAKMHAVAVGALPALHADPFDRILVAQALSEPMRLITHDAKVAAYSDTVIRV